ncbi:MAG: hypothetical protein LC772_04425, partial [Chloroflexi bacterium]|nr:hypothetical protein [Chloroflexota bacterium]
DTPILLLLGLRQALLHCPPAAVAEHLEKVGITEGQIQDDLAAAQLAGRWVVLQTARGAGRGVHLTRRTAGALTAKRPRRRAPADAQPSPPA